MPCDREAGSRGTICKGPRGATVSREKGPRSQAKNGELIVERYFCRVGPVDEPVGAAGVRRTRILTPQPWHGQRFSEPISGE